MSRIGVPRFVKSKLHLYALFGVASLLAACVWTGSEGTKTSTAVASSRARSETREREPWQPLSDVSGSVVLARQGQRTLAYVADEDQALIATVDVDAQKQLSATPLGATPGQLLPLAEGRLAVTLRDQNRVALYEAGDPGQSLVYRCSRSVAAEPIAIARTKDRLLVTSGWGRRLTALSLDALAELSVIELPREPRAVVVDEEGARAFVSHVVGGQLSVVELEGKRPIRAISLRAGERQSTQGYALAKLKLEAGTRVFAPNAAVHPGNPRISHGYGSFLVRSQLPIVSVIDPAAEKSLSVQVTEGKSAPNDWEHVSGHGEECLLPRAAAASGTSLFVVCQGTDTLLELDARAVEPVRVELRRWRVPDGPTGVAIDRGQRALVWSQFAGELAIVDLSKPATREAVLRVATARAPKPRYDAEQARGRSLFHRTFDPRISADGRACASCHPDGRDDGLTWSTPEGPRQTIMLAGRVAGSAPFGWFGDRPTLELHLQKTLPALGGAGFSGAQGRAEIRALARWLEVMPAPRWEAAAGIEHARSIERGARLFHDPAQGCGRCHTAAETDGARHDVKSGNVNERSLLFDTPSLRFVGGTAPYFHDGRYPTLEALLVDSDGKMGHTRALSRDDRAAVIEYLESLGQPLRVEGFEPAPASMAFPEGFAVPAAPAQPMPEPAAPHPRSLSALQRDLHPLQPNVKPVAIDVRALPLYWEPPADQRDVRPERLPVRDEAPDLLVTFEGFKTREAARAHGGASARVAVKDRGFGFIQVSLDRQPVLPNGRGGAGATCRPDRVFFDGVLWETLARSGDGLSFDGATGWFSQNECRAFVSRRVRALAVPIAPGLIYGFRTRCTECSEEKLHIVTADVDEWQSDPFTHLVLPLARGRAVQREGVASRASMRRWQKLGVGPAPAKALIGVQVSWGVRETQPTAIAYVATLD